MPLPMTSAALGGSIEVPTVSGERARISLRPAPKAADTSACPGKGMSILRHQGQGDMYVEASSRPPSTPHRQAAQAAAGIADAGTDDKTSPESHSFFDKVKELWQDLRGVERRLAGHIGTKLGGRSRRAVRKFP
ncbi:MAG: DnaJ C-terminal domain-containing protein [Rhodospirillales bacterium]